MITMVTFTDIQGKRVFVNPEHVACVRGWKPDKDGVEFDSTAIILALSNQHAVGTVFVEGDPLTIVKALCGVGKE